MLTDQERAQRDLAIQHLRDAHNAITVLRHSLNSRENDENDQSDYWTADEARASADDALDRMERLHVE